MLNITKTIKNNEADFALEGRLDTVTAPDLEKELKASLDGVTDLRFKDIKEKVLYWVSTMQSCLPAEAAEKLLALVQAVPHDNHMIHGDFHTKTSSCKTTKCC